jgi:SAM-dependent methyltransferase
VLRFGGMHGHSAADASPGVLVRLQALIKSWGSLYYFLLNLFGPIRLSSQFRRQARELLQRHDTSSVIVNVGSGPAVFHGRRDIINVDMEPYREVGVVGDAYRLPFRTGSVDLVINVAMLEHVQEPARVVAEMFRICKPGGTVFCYVPFLIPFHAAPEDYHRWTETGARALFGGFETADVAIGAGPASGLLWLTQESLATAVSFGSKRLHDVVFIILMVLLFPVKYADVVLEWLPSARYAAAAFFVVARKPF